jgi:hypothetical protein
VLGTGRWILLHNPLRSLKCALTLKRRHVAPCSTSSHDVLEAPMASQIDISQRYDRCYHCHTGWRRALKPILSSFATALRLSADVPTLRCSATSPSSRWISLMLLFMWASLPNRATVASCPPSTIRHLQSCSRRLQYGHLARAAGAIRYAIRKRSRPKCTRASLSKVNDKRYNATQIHAL